MDPIKPKKPRQLLPLKEPGVFIYRDSLSSIPRSGPSVFGRSIRVRRDPPTGGRAKRWIVELEGERPREARSRAEAEAIAAQMVDELSRPPA